MNECYYCNAKPVHKDAHGFVYIHNAECPILDREVSAMVEGKTPMSLAEPIAATVQKMRKHFYG